MKSHTLQDGVTGDPEISGLIGGREMSNDNGVKKKRDDSGDIWIVAMLLVILFGSASAVVAGILIAIAFFVLAAIVGLIGAIIKAVRRKHTRNDYLEQETIDSTIPVKEGQESLQPVERDIERTRQSREKSITELFREHIRKSRASVSLKSFAGKTQVILGILIAAFFGLTLFLGTGYIIKMTLVLIGVLIAFKGIMRGRFVRRFKEYATVLSVNPFQSTEQLANHVGISVSNVRNDLRKMTRKNYFKDAYYHTGSDRIVFAHIERYRDAEH